MLTLVCDGKDLSVLTINGSNGSGLGFSMFTFVNL